MGHNGESLTHLSTLLGQRHDAGEPAGSGWPEAELLAVFTHQLQEEPPTEFIPQT